MSKGNYVDLESFCQEVWQIKDLTAKRAKLREMVTKFRFKKTTPEFMASIDKAGLNECDKIATNIAMFPTNAVIK